MTTRDQAFLRAVGDEDCTEILGAVQEEAKTVPELSEDCDVPLSTAYRKVSRLQEAGLVVQKNRIQRNCKPKTVYERSFEAAVVQLDKDGAFDVEFLDTAADRSAALPVGEASQQFASSD
jgi:predicted transcriptional regulator